jgi:protein-S-isoprenylcysteine O-methyltransferase Ste14
MLWFSAPTSDTLAIGFAMAIVGEMVRFWGVSYAGSETRTTGTVGGTHLVTSGPYAYVRNPLYIGNILMYLGVGIMSNALMPYLQLVALAYFIFQYSAIIRIEEEYLSKAFPDWKEYSAHVHRFIPGLTALRGHNDFAPNFSKAARSERSSLIALASLSLLLLLVFVFKGAA